MYTYYTRAKRTFHFCSNHGCPGRRAVFRQVGTIIVFNHFVKRLINEELGYDYVRILSHHDVEGIWNI